MTTTGTAQRGLGADGMLIALLLGAGVLYWLFVAAWAIDSLI